MLLQHGDQSRGIMSLGVTFINKLFERGMSVSLMVSMFLTLIRVLGCLE